MGGNRRGKGAAGEVGSGKQIDLGGCVSRKNGGKLCVKVPIQKLNSVRSSNSSSRLTNAHPSQVKEPHPTLSDGGPAEAEQE